MGEDEGEGVHSSGIAALGNVRVGLQGAGTTVYNGSLEGCETDDCDSSMHVAKWKEISPIYTDVHYPQLLVQVTQL